MSDEPSIGAVLTYRLKGITRPCGQIIGADGRGDYAYVIMGDADDAHEWAKNHINRVRKSGTIIEDLILVTADEGYYGPSLRIIDLDN